MQLSTRSERIRIKADGIEVEGTLCLPDDPVGIVIFVNECGDISLPCRLPRSDDYLASVLREAHLGTLWLDLAVSPAPFSQEPPEDHHFVLVRRLRAACDWVRQHHATEHLPLGLAGVGEGAAAVLRVAAALRQRVFALVARGARTEPDVLGPLARISAPTLLIAGGLDECAIETSRTAYTTLRCKKRFEIVPGATPAFDEPGSTEVVVRLVRSWFMQHVHRYA